MFLPVGGSSLSKASKGWLAADTRRLKKASSRSRHVNQLACAGQRLRRVCGLGAAGWMVTTALLMAQRFWTGQ